MWKFLTALWTNILCDIVRSRQKHSCLCLRSLFVVKYSSEYQDWGYILRILCSYVVGPDLIRVTGLYHFNLLIPTWVLLFEKKLGWSWDLNEAKSILFLVQDWPWKIITWTYNTDPQIDFIPGPFKQKLIKYNWWKVSKK